MQYAYSFWLTDDCFGDVFVSRSSFNELDICVFAISLVRIIIIFNSFFIVAWMLNSLPNQQGDYPASRGFSTAIPLARTLSFACLVFRVVGLHWHTRCIEFNQCTFRALASSRCTRCSFGGLTSRCSRCTLGALSAFGAHSWYIGCTRWTFGALISSWCTRCTCSLGALSRHLVHSVHFLCTRILSVQSWCIGCPHCTFGTLAPSRSLCLLRCELL